MLPRSQRLNRSSSITRTLKAGQRVNGLGVRLTVQSRVDETRATVLVGLDFSKSAVTRNRARRQLREIVRANFPRLKQGYYVIGIKPFARPWTYAQLKAELEKLLRTFLQ